VNRVHPAVGRARSFLLPVPLLAAALVIAACGGGSATTAPASPLPPGVVGVQASEYKFEPSAITVPAGAATFAVKNGGSEAHQFEILEGETVLGGVLDIAPGATKDLAVTLDAGSYTFVCTLNGHDLLGMKGTLTVGG
jgi:plastocyanin